MSNSQEQSLNENVVFLPVNESSPEFLYCERERQAVERLLSAGPEAFYSYIGSERSGCFLSPEEVSQITSWAQDYRFNPEPVRREANGEEGGSEMDYVCSTYFPCYSDIPGPNLDLGWPEKSPWVPKESVTVHTSPPAVGDPPVREVIRWNLQNAKQVIAVVTDRLTDGAIIGDLHNAASRGVPVYIILNQRSIQENFTLNRLRHPNMQVRVIGGKTFCSRAGRMVVGEMKDNFLLLDLETVIHGSYSLTWTDTHLHRQLITVLRGPVVDSFDREFRILFAASRPVPDTWRVAGTHVDVTHQLKDLSSLGLQKHFLSEPEITSPSSPPADCVLDWAAMGLVQNYFEDSPLDQHEDILVKEMPLQNNIPFHENTPFMDGLTDNENQFVHKRRVSDKTSPVTNNVPDKTTTFNNKQPPPTDPTTSERMKRVEHIIEKKVSRQISLEKSGNLDDRATSRLDKATEHNMIISSSKRRERSWRDDESSINETSSRVENTPSSRKPVILSIPHSENFGSLSDILKKIQRSSSGLLKRGSKAAVSDMSHSMMDLSVHNTDHDERLPVPRFNANQAFNPGHMTPAFALMKKRNDNLKASLYSTPEPFMPTNRPRSSTYGLSRDWRRSLAEREEEKS